MPEVSFRDARAPAGMRLYAVGDIHGRLDLLSIMHSRIMDEILRDRPDDWRIVYLGDYEDRGPDSRGVIEFLSRTCTTEKRVIALRGNHDAGFLEFLGRLDIEGAFVRNGGLETARSYGVALDLSSRERAMSGHAALVEAVPPAHLAFLRSLPLTVSLGDFFFCHAGIRPGIPLEDQDVDDLLWIRDDFHRHRGLYAKVIVHGHTPVGQVEIMPNRVNIDTGACYRGRLTAIAVEDDRKRFLDVSG